MSQFQNVFVQFLQMTYDELEQTISPSAASSNYGIDLYSSAVAFVEEKLSST